MSFVQTPAATNDFVSKVYEAIDSMNEQEFANCLTENCTANDLSRTAGCIGAIGKNSVFSDRSARTSLLSCAVRSDSV